MTDLQARILEALADGQTMTPNAIGFAIGAKTVVGGRGMNGRGKGPRVFGPAQQIIAPLTSLERAGLIAYSRRPDGLSGTAYSITAAGREAIR